MMAGPSGVVPPGQNGVAATVREVVFMGEVTRYGLETRTGLTLLVKQQNRAGLPPLHQGDEALVSWAVADTRLVR